MTNDPDDASGLIHDWAATGPYRFEAHAGVRINDETLREGLQSASVVDPPIEAKLEILHLMEALGIECASMGLPCAGQRQKLETARLCREIADGGLKLRPNLGGRTVRSDVEAIIDVAQQVGYSLEACLFIGSSPIRQYAQEWNLAQMLGHTRDCVGLAVKAGLSVTYITEDTARSSPEHLEVLLRAAVDAGATRVCLCDTVGGAIPAGVRNLVGWVRERLELWQAEVEIDWHGHRDRDLGLANTLAAIEAGATRVHGTAYGLGERVGNTSTESILVNLKLLGLRDADLSRLQEYVETVTRALGVKIAGSAPVVGANAFRTAAGVHAAAILKALQKQQGWLADQVYSGIPAGWLGRRQEVEIGPLSGRSNVLHFLLRHEREAEPAAIEAVLKAAKQSKRVLTDAEVLAILDQPGETA